MSKKVELSKGMVAIVDDRDFELVARFNWCVSNRGYARTTVRLGMIGGKVIQATMYLHQLIMRPPKGMEVDHRNHDSLDCRRSEMRICTHSQNLQNQVATKGKSSQFKGVSRHKAAAKWMAYINLNGKRIHLGEFDNELAAARAYDTAARELFGEFACLNFRESEVTNVA